MSINILSVQLKDYIGGSRRRNIGELNQAF